MLLHPVLTYSQQVISGTILDEVTKTPIAYVNIGILNSTTGTISNKNGSFSIEIPKKLLDNELLFSAIGYAEKVIAISSFKKGAQIIYLTEKINNLDEVVISASPKKLKKTWLGNGKHNIFVQGKMYSDTASAGGAMALLIDKADNDLNYIEKASLYITRNTLPEFKVRVRFLAVDPDNNDLPGRDLFGESVVITSTMKRGWLDFELAAYQIKIDAPSYYVMLEWILDDEDRKYITQKTNEVLDDNPQAVIIDTVVVDNKKIVRKDVIASIPIPGTFFADTRTKSHLKKYSCYYRTNSLAKWIRASSIVSAKVLMTNKPTVLNTTNPNSTTAVEKNNFLSLEQRLTQWGEAFLEQQYTIPGMQVSISKKGKTIFSKGFGFADVENKLPVTNKTKFRIASVTKPMTSVGIMKLAAEHKIDLDASIATYFPSFPAKKYPITTRQLAAHTAGIRDYHELDISEVLVQEHYESAIDAVSIFANDSLQFKPGSQFLYSTYGYQLLGAIIESVTNQPYLDYMQAKIWKPLGMTSTYGDVKDSIFMHKSKFYDTKGEVAVPYDLSSSYPSGGLISTTEDLLKFGNALLDTTFLSSTFKEQLFKNQPLNDSSETNYGLGWYLKNESNNHQVWYHSGELPSSGAVLLIYPDDEIVISMLTNSPVLTKNSDGVPEGVYEIRELIDKSTLLKE